jgi:hypothetical protein
MIEPTGSAPPAMKTTTRLIDLWIVVAGPSYGRFFGWFRRINYRDL